MKFEDMAAEEMMNTLDERLSHYSANLSKHHFSLAYRIRRYQTIKAASQGSKVSHRFTVKRVRYVLLSIILAAFLLTGFTVLFTIGRFTFFDYSDHSAIFLSRSPDDKAKIDNIYGLPEEDGWKLTDSFSDETWSTRDYIRGKTKIAFMQSINNFGTMGNISTDRAKIEMLSLYSKNDGFMLDFGNDDSLIYWIYDGYLFSISGNVDKNEAIKLAHSTKIIDSP